MVKAEKSDGQESARRSQPAVVEDLGETAVNQEVVERHEKLTEDVDEILSDIDDVLETNAAEFVRNYIQKGGQ